MKSVPLVLVCGLVCVLSCALPEPRPSAEAAEWIPLELHRDSYVYVSARVEGTETQALLDSGASMSCVSSAMAEALGLVGGMKAQALGFGGPVDAEVFSGIDLEVGNRRIEDTSVVAIDFSEVEAVIGRPTPLILGRDVFEEFVVDIDYPRRRVAFHEPADFTYEGPAVELELHSRRGLYSIDLEIEGRPARVVVDTGRGNALSVYQEFAEESGLLEGRGPMSTTLAGGVGGRSEARMTTMQSVDVGGMLLEAVPARIVARDGPGATTSDAGLGTPLLGRFRAIFDTGRDRLLLEPDAASLTAPFARDRLGLKTRLEQGGLRVDHVAAGSPAAAAGWSVGTLVVEIDGQRVDALFWTSRHDWNECEPGTRVTLVVEDGTSHELVAADYF